MRLARFDTLFLRLFVLMWVALVASHLVAFSVVAALTGGPGDPTGRGPLPPLMSLPPGGITIELDEKRPPGQDRARPPGLPTHALWLDYGVRALVIGLFCAAGARWIAAPMRRLSHAADHLAVGLARGRAPTPLDERNGTVEVRTTAHVFNTMAQRLQEQFDARGLHMAALSHDLRTPLARLRMRLEAAPPALADAAAADIHEMTGMMDGTLAVLREQQGGQPAGLVELRSLLEAIVDDHRVAGHEVTLAAGGPLRARARPAALRRVLDNLVGNALRYGGGAQIGLAQADGRAEIVVDDRGPGIPDDQLEQAFEPWVRLTSSHARAGHGLGLAISRDLAERDGGTLTLANRPGGGLRACLQLPTTVSTPT